MMLLNDHKMCNFCTFATSTNLPQKSTQPRKRDEPKRKHIRNHCVTKVLSLRHCKFCISGLLPPSDLTFSEITSRSFRASWVPPTTEVLSYLLRFRKAEDVTGDYISMAVPGDTTTAVLPHLYPLTAYEVNVFSQYARGDSFALTGTETTLEGTGMFLSFNTT